VPLPQHHALGYHFCKWANVSAEMIIERNRNFTEFGFPLDVLWMDIEWADQYSE
jgi:alpha 1,3-glucosidase